MTAGEKGQASATEVDQNAQKAPIETL